MKVLFCGLPLPCGGHHLRLAPGADRGAILQCLDRTLEDMAARHGAKLIVFKELPDEDAGTIDDLAGLGYVRGDVPPNYHIRRQFTGLSEYGTALRAGYRRAMTLSLRKFEGLALTVTHMSDPSEIARRFDDRLHRLYLHVWRRSPNRLECFPLSFFKELPLALPGKVVLSVIERAGEPVAFGYGVMAGRSYHSLYLGYDPTLNEAGNLYFNITLKCLDHAFASGASELVLGQTADEFKARLGAVAEPLSFLARAPNPLVHMALKAFAGQIFPAVALPSPHHVFVDAARRLPPQQTA
jgi:predicted N-acyltransferase